MRRMQKWLTLIVCMMMLLPGVPGDEKVKRERSMKLPPRERFKIKWLPYHRWKKAKEKAREFWRMFRWRDRARMRLRGYFSPAEVFYQRMRAEIEEAVWRRDFERLKVVLNDVDVVDSGAGLEIGQTYFRETWPSSADGTYGNGDTINADKKWVIESEAGAKKITISDGEAIISNDGASTGTVLRTDDTFQMKHMQVLRFKYKLDSHTSGSGGYAIIGKAIGNYYMYVYFSSSGIHLLGESDITLSLGVYYEISLYFDMIERKAYLYIDGEYKQMADFYTGYGNTIEFFKFEARKNSEIQFRIKDILIADTIESSAVYFYDTANEDNLDDYTKGGNTQPTWDSTEKAYKLYDDAAGTKYSSMYKDANTPQDNVVLKFAYKKGANDTSTHAFGFTVRYGSASDGDTYIMIRHNGGANILRIENTIDASVINYDNVSWTPTAGTWYYFMVIIDYSNRIRVFRGTSWDSMVEISSIAPTKSKRFYDGRLSVYGYHNDGEVLEKYVKNIEITASPKVLAPRSNPPWLLTQSIKPDVENTLWEELAGYWDIGTVEDGGGVYGNSVNNTDTKVWAQVKYIFDSPVDLSGVYAIRVIMEVDNITDINNAYCSLVDSNGTYSYKVIDVSGIIEANKKIILTFWLNEYNNVSVHNDIKRMEPKLGYSTSQTATIKVSDIQLLGGGAHHVAGEPLYQSPGYDDLAEWDTSGSTGDAPTWETDHYNFEDSTAADNVISMIQRNLKFNMNGNIALRFKVQIQADDTNTLTYFRVLVYNDSGNYAFVKWENSAGTDKVFVLVRSNDVWMYGSSCEVAKDTDEHEFVLYLNKEMGFVLFMDGKRILQYNTIGGSWVDWDGDCLLYTSPSPRDLSTSRMPSSA